MNPLPLIGKRRHSAARPPSIRQETGGEPHPPPDGIRPKTHVGIRRRKSENAGAGKEEEEEEEEEEDDDDDDDEEEEEEEEKEQYLMVLLESGRRGIISLDQNGNIVHHNHKAKKLTCRRTPWA